MFDILLKKCKNIFFLGGGDFCCKITGNYVFWDSFRFIVKLLCNK